MSLNGATAAWRPEEDARLRALWADGLSTNAIAAALGRSKNSVIGRAHRLKLPARPSPIERKAAAWTIAEAVEALRCGVPAHEAAKKAGVSTSTLQRRGWEAGVNRDTRDTRKTLPSPGARMIEGAKQAAVMVAQPLRAAALAAVAAGKTLDEAGRIAGAHPSTVAEWARQAGVKPPAPVRMIAPAEPPAPARPSPAPYTRPVCCWPMWGDKEAPTHRYCDAPRAVRRGSLSVYCAEHHALAWRPLGSVA